MTRTVPIELHCMRCRMTVKGTIEVDEDGGDEAYLQTVPDHRTTTKVRCPVCGPSYPREKIMELTLGEDPRPRVKTVRDLRAEAKERKAKLQDPSLCPYKVGDQVKVLFKGLGWVHAKEEEQTVKRVTPTGGVRLSDGNLYRPEEHRGEVIYRYWSGDGGSHGRIIGFVQKLLT